MSARKFWSVFIAIAVLIGGAFVFVGARLSAEDAHGVPAPAIDETAAPEQTSETAVFAGGCFWGVQGVFQHVKGVSSAVSGYAGGPKEAAHYEIVGTGSTGHAESVQVVYNPQQISYGELLQIYFSVAHDPTELNRQGPDSGTQYRSAIFPTNDEQARIAKAYIEQLNAGKTFSAPVVTTIEPGKSFYPAEGYHQDFLATHPSYPYIVINDLPKVSALKQSFPDLYREEPALVSAAPSN